MPPVVIAAGVAGAAGIASSAIAGSKAKKAITKSSTQAADTQLTLAREAAALSEPFRAGGVGALDLLNKIFVGGETDKLLDLPGIAFLREQGEQALGRFQASRGNFLSGQAAKEALRFNQGLAATNIAQATNPLFNLAGLGQAAAAGQAANLSRAGTGAAQTQLIAGEARASQALNIGSSINRGLNNFLFTSLLGGAFDKRRKEIAIDPSGNIKGTFNTIFSGQFG